MRSTELLGRQDGGMHGKGSSMHIVCTQVPVGAGLIFVQMYLGNKTATPALHSVTVTV